MVVFKQKEQDLHKNKTASEIKIYSRAVSRGVAIGKAVCLFGNAEHNFRSDLSKDNVEKEIQRFNASVLTTNEQLDKINNQTKSNIFGTHKLILEDRSLQNKIVSQISEKRVNAEFAVKLVIDDYINKYKKIPNEHLRERFIDLQDISERVLGNLDEVENTKQSIEKGSVIVAKRITPSTLIELLEYEPAAILTETGGWTSHTFILAREMNLPAVTGTINIYNKIKTGDSVVVDGFSGQIIINPHIESLKKYEVEVAHFQKVNVEQISVTDKTIKTLDGEEIIIRSNLDVKSNFKKAKKLGAKGVGLFRSEFLFNQSKRFPDEQEQLDYYRQLGKQVGEDGINIRTFDLSLEQISIYKHTDQQMNPAIGMRGIRLSISEQKQFKIQIRALLKASAEYKINILLPMITDVSEIIISKQIIQEEKKKLKKSGIKFGNPKIGAMIEVPSAVFTIEDIAEEVDFLSLGTNDLVQYLLAVDRDNDLVADIFRTLHPAVIKAVEIVITAAEKTSTPLVICGEMAGSAFYTPLLIGLGAKDLSMNVNSILKVRRIISGIAYEEARELVKKIKKCKSSEEIENLVSFYFKENWSHLFSPEILPPSNTV